MLASPQENRAADKPSAEKLLDDIGTAPFAVRVEDEKSETPLHKLARVKVGPALPTKADENLPGVQKYTAFVRVFDKLIAQMRAECDKAGKKLYAIVNHQDKAGKTCEVIMDGVAEWTG